MNQLEKESNEICIIIRKAQILIDSGLSYFEAKDILSKTYKIESNWLINFLEFKKEIKKTNILYIENILDNNYREIILELPNQYQVYKFYEQYLDQNLFDLKTLIDWWWITNRKSSLSFDSNQCKFL